MWKYRHSVKENPKSGYKRLIGNRAVADRVLCVSTRNWECRRPRHLVLIQEDNPKTHRLNREISCETGIHWLTVHKIIYRDL